MNKSKTLHSKHKDDTITKKQKISKSLDVLLAEVSQGQYEEFREYLEQNNITNLNLCGKAANTNLFHLVKALQNTSVSSLNLRDNEIDDVRVKDLSLGLHENNNICALYLGGNDITDVGAKDLSEALQNNKSLQILHLDYNHIGPLGAKELGIGLKHNKSIRDLHLEFNQIGAAGAKDLIPV